MVEISPLTEPDRAEWEVLARAFKATFQTEVGDDGYEQTWRRLLNGEQIRGIAARQDGRLAGIAHYYFHASVWSATNCYLADLFVDQEMRRRGIAQAMIVWVAKDAEKHGAVRLHWHTPQDNATTHALYDKVARATGHITYSRRLNQS